MTPIQQLMLGVGASKKTYMDDVFSTYLYRGNGANNRAITGTGVNLSENGGLLWIKSRSDTEAQVLVDSAQGVNKVLNSSTNGASITQTNRVSAFGTDGFTLGATSDWGTNRSGTFDYASWSFRKAPGFFDCVTYTGNNDGTNGQNISHNLGSVPGMIIVKKTSSYGDWLVYHKSKGKDYAGYLHATNAFYSTSSWDNTEPTSTNFRVKLGDTNNNGSTYVAYVFAGGESTAATARSVDFDGSDDRLTIPDNNAWDLGTGDFTFECWVKGTQAHTSYVTVAGSYGAEYKFMIRWSSPDVGTGWSFFPDSGVSSTRVFGQAINDDQWHHLAVVRDGTKISTYTDGIFNNSITSSAAFNDAAAPFEIGHRDSGEHFNGKISNLRLVKGTAVYTSSFKPPTAPLENITNTVLLCCNNSSATGSTVTPGTITANSSPTASTDSPFDDPAGFVFGEAGDQNVIKTGSYTGNGSAGLEVNVGFEPQWLMIKNADGANTDWYMIDMMRGSFNCPDADSAEIIKGNATAAEFGTSAAHPTSTGFRLTSSYSHVNHNTHTYVYVAIRRPDGYVGKPVETAASVFAMDTGAGSSTIPNFDSNFVADFAFYRQYGTSENWWTASRLTGSDFVRADTTDTRSTNTANTWDSNVGWGRQGMGTIYQSWMWKRHAGLDVVTYKGEGSQRGIPHNLSKTPEMIWAKSRTQTRFWPVFHKNLSSSGVGYYVRLNDTNSQTGSNGIWSEAPTSTHFTVGDSVLVNGDGEEYIAMLFSSVDGISKVGGYTGNSGTISITTGFQPRFLIIMNTTWDYGGWIVFDTLRGLGSGNDKYMYLNTNAAQATNQDFGDISSTGFSMGSGDFAVNANNHNFIYYAHA